MHEHIKKANQALKEARQALKELQSPQDPTKLERIKRNAFITDTAQAVQKALPPPLAEEFLKTAREQNYDISLSTHEILWVIAHLETEMTINKAANAAGGTKIGPESWEDLDVEPELIADIKEF